VRSNRRARLVLTILLLAAFSLITLDYRSGALGGVRSAASTVFGPLENGADDVTHPIGSWFTSIGHLGSYKSQNAVLERQIATLRKQLHLTQAERVELGQDEKLLHLAGLARFTVVAARVTAYGGALGFEDTVTINRGTANGISTGETVITGDGLVGRTIVCGRTTSTILLADDPTFTVGVRTEGRQLELGALSGGGANKAMQLQLYSNTAPLTVGEQLVSAGSNRNSPFVPEVPIGQVTHVNPLGGGLAETAVVAPFVDFTALDVVGVVTHAPQSIKHDSLLPASPTPAPTVTVTVTATPGTSGSPGASSTSPTTPGSSP
jgi:rod shape-determining protein MreC